MLRRVDDERHMHRFTPRKPTSNWSAVNVAEVAALREAGRMRPAGEAAFARRRPDRTGVYSFEQPADPQARARAACAVRGRAGGVGVLPGAAAVLPEQASWWVISAKKPETRARRLALLISDSAAGERIKSLRPPRPRADRGV